MALSKMIMRVSDWSDLPGFGVLSPIFPKNFKNRGLEAVKSHHPNLMRKLTSSWHLGLSWAPKTVNLYLENLNMAYGALLLPLGTLKLALGTLKLAL